MTHILVFGDSIAWGAWDAQGGWVERLKNLTNEKNKKYSTDKDFWCLIYNLGVSGEISDNIITRFDTETKSRLSENKENIIIFALGTNDSSFLKSKKDNWVPIKRFEKNIQKLIDLSSKRFAKTIFLGITPVDEDKTNPIPWATDIYYTNENVKQYNKIMSKICALNGAEFIDIFEVFSKSGPNRLLEDGLHPNTDGHKLIFEAVKGFLDEKKVI